MQVLQVFLFEVEILKKLQENNWKSCWNFSRWRGLWTQWRSRNKLQEHPSFVDVVDYLMLMVFDLGKCQSLDEKKLTVPFLVQQVLFSYIFVKNVVLRMLVNTNLECSVPKVFLVGNECTQGDLWWWKKLCFRCKKQNQTFNGTRMKLFSF